MVLPAVPTVTQQYCLRANDFVLLCHSCATTIKLSRGGLLIWVPGLHAMGAGYAPGPCGAVGPKHLMAKQASTYCLLAVCKGTHLLLVSCVYGRAGCAAAVWCRPAVVLQPGGILAQGDALLQLLLREAPVAPHHALLLEGPQRCRQVQLVAGGCLDLQGYWGREQGAGGVDFVGLCDT